MDLGKCLECIEDAVYQCLDDSVCVCTKHLRKTHMRHKFKPIPKGEIPYRKSLLVQLQTDIQKLSPSGLRETCTAKVLTRASEAAESFKAGLEDWVAVHRKQLEGLDRIAKIKENQAWPWMYEALVGRLARDYAGPLINYEVELTQLRVGLYPPPTKPLEEPKPQISSILEEEKSFPTDLLSRFLRLLKPASANNFFLEHRHKLLPEIVKAWDTQNFHQISLKGANSEIDTLAVALLIARSVTVRSVIIPKCGFSAKAAKCLGEALKRTKADVKTLDISGNEMGDEGFAELFPVIKSMKSLTLLAIRGVGLSDASIAVLRSVSEVKLDAGGNRFTREGKMTLMDINIENKV